MAWQPRLNRQRRGLVEDDAEMFAISVQDCRIVRAQLALALLAVNRLYQHPAAQRDPSRRGEPRADQRPREVRLRRRRVPPAGWLEVGQVPGTALEPVLGHAVLQ